MGFVLFLSLFALDAFDGGWSWPALLGFLIHLWPSLALLALIVIAWKYDWFGVLVFLLAAVGYVWLAGPGRPWSWYAAISGPALLLAILFLISWLAKRKKSAA